MVNDKYYSNLYRSWCRYTIYLEEYAKDNFFTSFVKISISNLVGVPSIVFGLLGLTLFVRGGGIQALALGNSVIAPR